jgi:hypothetical protein
MLGGPHREGRADDAQPQKIQNDPITRFRSAGPEIRTSRIAEQVVTTRYASIKPSQTIGPGMD